MVGKTGAFLPRTLEIQKNVINKVDIAWLVELKKKGVLNGVEKKVSLERCQSSKSSATT